MTSDVHLPGIAQGDTQAFAAWMALCEPRMRASLHSFARTVDTEAVLQEALLRCWQVAPQVEPDGQPDALLRLGIRIARNLALDETRRRRPQALPPEDLQREGPGVEPVLPDPLLRQAIAWCRELLKGPARQALEARLASGGQEDDPVLARRCGMKLNTFLQNVRRARLSLQECLRKKGVEVSP